jgi:hypothetical protein
MDEDDAGEFEAEDAAGRPPERASNPALSPIMREPTRKAGAAEVVSIYRYFPPLADLLLSRRIFDRLLEASEFSSTRDELRRITEDFVTESRRLKKKRYITAGEGFLTWLDRLPDVSAHYDILAQGQNMKIDREFYEFSVLPGVTCPGAGDCYRAANGKRGWCYSYKMFNYAKALFRRIQNTVLLRLREGQELIAGTINSLPEGKTVRLYVDGDFDSADSLDFWMRTIANRPDLHFYGYSKSWELLLGREEDGQSWPENYALNISGGSRYDNDADMRRRVLNLSCTRGPFVAIRESHHRYHYPDPKKEAALTVEQYAELKAQQKIDSAGYFKQLRKAARDSGIKKPWPCPGYCGSCLKDGTHACGSWQMHGVSIVIGVH